MGRDMWLDSEGLHAHRNLQHLPLEQPGKGKAAHQASSHHLQGAMLFPLHRSWHLQLQLHPSSCWDKLGALPEPGSERCAQGEACRHPTLPRCHSWHAPAQVSACSGHASCLASKAAWGALPCHPAVSPPMAGVEMAKDSCDLAALPGESPRSPSCLAPCPLQRCSCLSEQEMLCRAQPAHPWLKSGWCGASNRITQPVFLASQDESPPAPIASLMGRSENNYTLKTTQRSELCPPRPATGYGSEGGSTPPSLPPASFSGRDKRN